jgi:hypothetical protein
LLLAVAVAVVIVTLLAVELADTEHLLAQLVVEALLNQL